MSRRTSQIAIKDYRLWLGSQLRDEHGNPEKTYWGLVTTMFDKEFGWILPMDENRLADGIDLRVDFARLEHMDPNGFQNFGPCSFLEVLIGLSRRMAFNAGGQAAGWAWQFLCNLELDRFSDPLTRPRERRAHAIMDTVIHRTYSPDGRGGFFPLTRSEDDQTQIELWYQMHAYIEELHHSEY